MLKLFKSLSVEVRADIAIVLFLFNVGSVFYLFNVTLISLVFAFTFLAITIVKCLLFLIFYRKEVDFTVRLFMSIFIFGPLPCTLTLWLNFATASSIYYETYAIRGVKYYTVAGKYGGSSIYVVLDLEKDAFKSCRGARTFDYSEYSERNDSITYSLRKGILGWEILKGKEIK